jgi:membrane peptidoglycan carboxypeptidase
MGRAVEKTRDMFLGLSVTRLTSSPVSHTTNLSAIAMSASYVMRRFFHPVTNADANVLQCPQEPPAQVVQEQVSVPVG